MESENRRTDFSRDIQDIQSLDIVPHILELICRSTGMGFAAIARVTEDKWITCAVKDEIQFGLKPGDELQIETTICNEIRDSKQPVIIDEVSKDELFRDHHTPKMYGFQSYISIPIILKDGNFFGTLCAIDPNPFPLKKSNIEMMFRLHADLISYHLQTLEDIHHKNELLNKTEAQLLLSLDDLRQYVHINSHTLQEPLRKLQMFSDILVRDESLPSDHKMKRLAWKINSLAGSFSTMISEVTGFGEISNTSKNVYLVELNDIVNTVCNSLKTKILRKKADVQVMPLGKISGYPKQLNLLFYHLIDNALNFSRPGIQPVITIVAGPAIEDDVADVDYLKNFSDYFKITIQDNGIGIDNAYKDQIFNLFVKLNPEDEFSGLGTGLSQAKKIMQNHEGVILVNSRLLEGTTFTLLFPIR